MSELTTQQSSREQKLSGLLREWQRIYNAMDSKHEDKHPTADAFGDLRKRTHEALSTPAALPAQTVGEYPPLPECVVLGIINGVLHGYTEIQMRAYVDADRAARLAAHMPQVAELSDEEIIGLARTASKVNNYLQGRFANAIFEREHVIAFARGILAASAPQKGEA